MKATGIVRGIDELGRIVIPKELRRKFGIESGDPIEIYVDGDKIILKKYQAICHFCGSADQVKSYKDKSICALCIEELGRI